MPEKNYKDGIKLSNLVRKDALRGVQLNTLQRISDVISKTAGPYGAYSMIMHTDALTEYTKDGHKVLSNFKFFRPLEKAIHDELLDITEHVIKKVGDGTTTAIQLSYYIYEALCSHNKYWESINATPYQIMDNFQWVVKEISNRIRSHKKENITPDDIYQICLISTNGNTVVAEDIANIYKQFDMDVYIELNTSNTESSLTKTYDGIILNKGFASPSFINRGDNTVEINNPNLYYFPDPVDTPEMITLFMEIFIANIYTPYKNGSGKYVPTVIMCPSISQDAESSLQDIEQIFYAFDQNNMRANKPPFCIITGINDRVDNIGDILTLCDIPSIRKYINPDKRNEDIEKGIAPSTETVSKFCGHADSVIIDMDKMKIINPCKMYDSESPVGEDGSREYSATYHSLINFLKKQIELESQVKDNINVLSELKRRLHSLTANFVEYYVGGVSAADRNNVKDLVEDAILNCRSAIENGIGYGAGFEGLRASREFKEYNDELAENLDTSTDNGKSNVIINTITDIIGDAYFKIIKNLYQSAAMSEEQATKLIMESLEKGKPYNIRERSFDRLQVYTSIETDTAILDAISKIITIMYTSNQAFLPDPMQNVYIEED